MWLLLGCIQYYWSKKCYSRNISLKRKTLNDLKTIKIAEVVTSCQIGVLIIKSIGVFLREQLNWRFPRNGLKSDHSFSVFLIKGYIAEFHAYGLADDHGGGHMVAWVHLMNYSLIPWKQTACDHIVSEGGTRWTLLYRKSVQSAKHWPFIDQVTHRKVYVGYIFIILDYVYTDVCDSSVRNIMIHIYIIYFFLC